MNVAAEFCLLYGRADTSLSGDVREAWGRPIRDDEEILLAISCPIPAIGGICLRSKGRSGAYNFYMIPRAGA